VGLSPILNLSEKEGSVFQHPENMRALVDMRLTGSRQAAADRLLAGRARLCGAKTRRPRRFLASWSSRSRRAPSAKPTVA
jgi:hypothetical protein